MEIVQARVIPSLIQMHGNDRAKRAHEAGRALVTSASNLNVTITKRAFSDLINRLFLGNFGFCFTARM
jgi:hypothetical protein